MAISWKNRVMASVFAEAPMFMIAGMQAATATVLQAARREDK